MKRYQLLLVVGLCVTSAPGLAAQQSSFALPADPSSAVITMDWVGGLTAPRKNTNPVLTIRSDGRVTVIDPAGNAGNKDAVLSRAELQDLLRFAISEQDFFAFNPSDVARAIALENARTGIGMGVADASDTVVHIRLADREGEARYNAVDVWARSYPSIKALGQLRAIELRLNRLVQELRAGGKPEIVAALTLANDYLKQQSPALPALTADDYLRTLEGANGRKTMQFLRDQGDGTNLVVTLRFEPNSLPQITSAIQRRSPVSR